MRLCELERKNDEMEHMVAEPAQNIRMLKDVNSEKLVSLTNRRRCVTYLRSAYEVSERRVYQVMQVNRPSYRYVCASMLNMDEEG